MDDNKNNCKTIGITENNRLKIKYANLLVRIDELPMYDGRNKGIDVYICERCKVATFTRYKDKGVTPFIMHCRRCGGSAKHEVTISESSFPEDNSMVKSWVRPTFEQMMKMDAETIEHVLKGGLVLEEEIK